MKVSNNRFVQHLKDPNSFWQTLALTALASLMYLVRAYPYFFKPQLFAEDGTVWLAQGLYNSTTSLIPQTYNGFYHYSERVFGFLVGRLPLQLAPALFSWTALVLFAFMTYYLLSSRTKILTNNFERLFVALALGLIANFTEFFFNFSNSIFLIGIIALLILIAKRSRFKWVDISEKIIFVLACLTLPFPWIFVPITVFDRLKYKAKNNFFLITSVVTSLIQGFGYLTSHADRSPVTLPSLISQWTLLEIYNQIIVPAVRFARIDIGLTAFGTGIYNALFVLFCCLLVAAATVLVIKKSNKQVWYLLFFLAGMTFSALKSPTIRVQLPIDAIKQMAVSNGANRYFVYGILAVTLIYVKTLYLLIVPRYRYYIMGAILTFGVITALQCGVLKINKGWEDYTPQWRAGVQRYYTGKYRETIVPLNPKPWTMGLDRPLPK